MPKEKSRQEIYRKAGEDMTKWMTMLCRSVGSQSNYRYFIEDEIGPTVNNLTVKLSRCHIQQ